jgi:hypothetical protein
VLLVGLAVVLVVLLGLGGGVAHDPRRRVAVAVGGVFHEFLLGQLESLGLAATRLIDGAALDELKASERLMDSARRQLQA